MVTNKTKVPSLVVHVPSRVVTTSAASTPYASRAAFAHPSPPTTPRNTHPSELSLNVLLQASHPSYPAFHPKSFGAVGG